MDDSKRYDSQELEHLRSYCKGLKEKERRHFLALQYKRLGKGSQRYLAEVFSCSRITITRGCRELEQGLVEGLDYSRQRRPGGGRKKKELTESGLVEAILAIVASDTAGSPTDATVKWTHLRPFEIAQRYHAQSGNRISHGTVKRILKEAGYCRRRPSKALATGKSPHRAEQFRLVFFFANLFACMEHNPILSIDTKKKERLGQLDRGGKVLCQYVPLVYSHDYAHLAYGRVVPHGIYDLKLNKGYVSIGTNNETAEMVGDNLIWWWEEFGIHLYPDAREILLFCDCGGANGYRHHAFKKELQRVAALIGLRIVVVHYPPYCSKWNPIEHRLFSQMHHAARGAIFLSYEQVKTTFEKTQTSTGLTVTVRINDRHYEKGLKIKRDQVDQHRILFHPQLPQFNYTILPDFGAG